MISPMGTVPKSMSKARNKSHFANNNTSATRFRQFLYRGNFHDPYSMWVWSWLKQVTKALKTKNNDQYNCLQFSNRGISLESEESVITHMIVNKLHWSW